jgi:hypothetical protein
MRNLGHIPVEPIRDDFANRLLNLFPKSLHIQTREIYPDNSELPSHIPHEISGLITRTCLFRRSMEMRIGERIVRVHMRMPYKYSHKCDKYMNRIALWLSVAGGQSSPLRPPCSVSSLQGKGGAGGNRRLPLLIYLYFSDHLKRMPTNNEPIDSINANTAFTSTCSGIYIYRYEEWFKVLIHETFHNLSMDFCNMNCDVANRRLNVFFKLPHLDIRLYEAYSETWALLMYSAITAFERTRDKSNMRLMISKFKTELDANVRFSLYQRMKVLRHMEVEPREKTAAFAYYVIKSSLVYHINTFLEWCISRNTPIMNFRKTPATITEFCLLVERLAMEIPTLPKMREPAYMKETLRMVVET